MMTAPSWRSAEKSTSARRPRCSRLCCGSCASTGARLLLDVSGVSFMDCAGLRALLTTRRRAELRGGFMRLIAVSRAVRRIIELTGAHEALAVERIATDRSA